LPDQRHRFAGTHQGIEAWLDDVDGRVTEHRSSQLVEAAHEQDECGQAHANQHVPSDLWIEHVAGHEPAP
jgi:hypothetical protein